MYISQKIEPNFHIQGKFLLLLALGSLLPVHIIDTVEPQNGPLMTGADQASVAVTTSNGLLQLMNQGIKED